MSERLGQLLLKANMVTEDQLRRALAEQRVKGGSLSSILIDLGFIKEEDLHKFLHQRYGVPSINVVNLEIDPKLAELIGTDFMRKHLVIPVKRSGSTLYVAMADPFDFSVIDDLKFHTGYHVEALVAPESDIRRAIDRFLNPTAALTDTLERIEDDTVEVVEREESFDLSELEKTAEEAPVV